jgi:Uma2 family endonuclease
LAFGFDVDFECLRSTTFRREDLQKGFEGDNSYYIRNAALIRRQDQIDLSVDPPPELVVEVDITRQSMKKLPLFAAMGIKEVWRFREGRLLIYTIHAGEIYEAAGSRVLPNVTADDLNNLLFARHNLTGPQWVQMAFEWAIARRPQS